MSGRTSEPGTVETMKADERSGIDGPPGTGREQTTCGEDCSAWCRLHDDSPINRAKAGREQPCQDRGCGHYRYPLPIRCLPTEGREQTPMTPKRRRIAQAKARGVRAQQVEDAAQAKEDAERGRERASAYPISLLACGHWQPTEAVATLTAPDLDSEDCHDCGHRQQRLFQFFPPKEDTDA